MVRYQTEIFDGYIHSERASCLDARTTAWSRVRSWSDANLLQGSRTSTFIERTVLEEDDYSGETLFKFIQHQAHHSSRILSVGFIAVAPSKCFCSKMFSTSSRTVARIGVRNFKVAVLGASGGIGQPLALLLKLDRNVTELALFDVVKTPGVAADISHCCTPAKVFFCEQLWFQNTIWWYLHLSFLWVKCLWRHYHKVDSVPRGMSAIMTCVVLRFFAYLIRLNNSWLSLQEVKMSRDSFHLLLIVTFPLSIDFPYWFSFWFATFYFLLLPSPQLIAYTLTKW